MDIIGLIISAIARIVTVFTTVGVAAMDVAEEGLRVPLQHIGVVGAAQTIAVAMVPVLSLIAAVYLLRGFLRGIVVVLFVLFTVHAVWPLITGHTHAI